MRITAKIILWITGLLLVISTAFQLLAMLGGVLLSDSPLSGEHPWLMPVWIAALVLLTAAFILTVCLGDRGRLPIVFAVAALIGAAGALAVALLLRQAFPPQISAAGGTQGLTVWRLCYRHYSSVAVGVLTAAAALLRLAINREEQNRRDLGEEHPTFDLSGAPVFRDNSTLGLTHFADNGEKCPERRVKRSVRRAREKAEELSDREQQ